MATIYYNVRGSFKAGGPSVHVARMAGGLGKKGHGVIYDNPRLADVAMCIINTGKILRKIDRNKTKAILRIDGIYNKLYNEKFSRKIRPDMTALHAELQRDIPLVDHTVYQSEWSRDRIWDEIIEVDRDYSIIHNGVDIKLFKPIPQPKDDALKLMHVGLMRDAYLMEMLVGVYKELKRRGHNTKLLLCGSMDGGCSKVFKANKDSGMIHTGHIKNTQMAAQYSKGDIYLDARQGASCNNTVAEAQACGLPVITPAWGGSCEMVKAGITGAIVDGGKWDYDERYIQAMADAAEFIESDLKDFKKQARTHAVAELTVDKMIEKYLKIMGV